MAKIKASTQYGADWGSTCDDLNRGAWEITRIQVILLQEIRDALVLLNWTVLRHGKKLTKRAKPRTRKARR